MSTPVERIVASIRAMPTEAIRRRIDETRCMTDEEVEERQRTERQERARRAAASLHL